MPFERATLDPPRRAARTSSGTDDARDAFIDAARRGARYDPGVRDASITSGVLVRLLPEWEHVRARPQRNAYHRFTVDRHSLEAVAECAALLDPDDPPGPASTATSRAAPRRDLLLLGALLHDIAKGRPRRPLGRRGGDRA